MNKMRRKRNVQSSSHGHSKYNNHVSRQYNRSRIEQELNNFYEYTHDPHTNIISPSNDGGGSLTGYSDDMSRSKRTIFEHPMDPEVNSIGDLFDTDNFDFSMEQETHDEQKGATYHHQHHQASTQKAPFVQFSQTPDELSEANKQCQSTSLNERNDSEGVMFTFQQEQEEPEIYGTLSSTPAPPKQVSPPIVQEAVDMITNHQDQGTVMDGFSVIAPSPQRMTLSYYDQNHREEPPGLLMINTSVSSSMTDDKTTSTSKSHISYDDTTMNTPSIAFFLNANKQELQNEGYSIADSHHYPSAISTYRKTFFDSFETNDTEESQTTRGYSRGSSKYTTSSPKILELRERKRLMERSHEKAFVHFPTVIEVDKFA